MISKGLGSFRFCMLWPSAAAAKAVEQDEGVSAVKRRRVDVSHLVDAQGVPRWCPSMPVPRLLMHGFPALIFPWFLGAPAAQVLDPTWVGLWGGGACWGDAG